jgi:hypothetical protein
VVRAIASGLGLLAFVAAIVVGALAAAGIIGDAARSFQVGGSEANIAPATSHLEPKTEHIDKTLTTGSLTWTVQTARQTPEVHGFALPPDPLRGNLLVVTFTVRNDSDGPLTLAPESLVLLDERGHKTPPAASVNTEYVLPRYAILFNERRLLDPGEEREGRVIFDLGGVPFEVGSTAGLSGFRLRLGDGDPTVQGEKYVDLGS